MTNTEYSKCSVKEIFSLDQYGQNTVSLIFVVFCVELFVLFVFFLCLVPNCACISGLSILWIVHSVFSNVYCDSHPSLTQFLVSTEVTITSTWTFIIDWYHRLNAYKNIYLAKQCDHSQELPTVLVVSYKSNRFTWTGLRTVLLTYLNDNCQYWLKKKEWIDVNI